MKNLISALYAKQCGVHKVIAKIDRINFSSVIKNLGIDSIVNPKQSTANSITRYVRALKNAMGNPVETLYKIIGEKAEVVEFIVAKPTKFLNVPLKALKLVKGVLVAAIVRKNEIIIPQEDLSGWAMCYPHNKDKHFSDFNDIIES